MKEDWKPFDLIEVRNGTTLYLHGVWDAWKRIKAVEVEKILKAIRRGWNIDIRFAIIEAGIDIQDLWTARDGQEKYNIAGEIALSWSIINGEVNFRGTSFEELVDFREVRFEKNAYFDEACFNGNAFFDGAYFKQAATFSGAKFKQRAYFQRARYWYLQMKFGRYFNKIDYYQSKGRGL